MKSIRRTWIFWCVSILHLGWGLALILSNSPIYSVGLSPYMILFNHHIWGILFVIISIASIVEILYQFHYGVIAILFQHLILTVSALTAIICIYKRSYADGVLRPWEFIFADQFLPIVVSIFHIIAIVDTYGSKNR